MFTAPDPGPNDGPNDGRDMTLGNEWWTLKHGSQPPNLAEFAGGMLDDRTKTRTSKTSKSFPPKMFASSAKCKQLFSCNKILFVLSVSKQLENKSLDEDVYDNIDEIKKESSLPSEESDE